MAKPSNFEIQMAEDGDDDTGTRDPSVGLATRTRTRTKKPTPYRVLMLNDDYTPMEFVVLCLQRFFRMNMEEATRVMLHVHQRGVGVCGLPCVHFGLLRRQIRLGLPILGVESRGVDLGKDIALLHPGAQSGKAAPSSNDVA